MIMFDVKFFEMFLNFVLYCDFLIDYMYYEFMLVCLMMGYFDFVDIMVCYVLDKICVELKLLKLYFYVFCNQGIFFEVVINKICDDFGKVLKLWSLMIILKWKVCGGFMLVVMVEWLVKKKC